jgi:hypothetical protein
MGGMLKPLLQWSDGSIEEGIRASIDARAAKVSASIVASKAR